MCPSPTVSPCTSDVQGLLCVYVLDNGVPIDPIESVAQLKVVLSVPRLGLIEVHTNYGRRWVASGSGGAAGRPLPRPPPRRIVP